MFGKPVQLHVFPLLAQELKHTIGKLGVARIRQSELRRTLHHMTRCTLFLPTPWLPMSNKCSPI